MLSQTLWMPDGYPIAATIYAPARTDAPRAVVIINCGAAVSQRFYASFAQFVALQGYTVISWDYRGVGQSAPARLTPRFEAGFCAIVADFDAVVGWVKKAYPGLPLVSFGHSIGGTFCGVSKTGVEFAAIATVGTQTAYWADWRPRHRQVLTYLQWHGLIPLLTHWFGYFPGASVSKLQNLPATFVRDWHGRRKSADYDRQLADMGLQSQQHRILAPVLAVSATDDPIATRPALDRYFGRFAPAQVCYRSVVPTDGPIGHFNFFRRRFGQVLWPIITDWIMLQLSVSERCSESAVAYGKV